MRHLVSLLLFGGLLAAASWPGTSWSRPALEIAAGNSFGVDGSLDGGGLSAAVSALWPVGERARFGITMFADDIGTQIDSLFDQNDPSVGLGLSASRHRWTWGGAWRGDYDLARGRRWSAGLTGTLGWWRVEDDRRGRFLAAAGAVGVGLGAEVRRVVSPRHELGFAVRYQELTSDRHSAYRRVDHYATGALLWRWTGTTHP